MRERKTGCACESNHKQSSSRCPALDTGPARDCDIPMGSLHTVGFSHTTASTSRRGCLHTVCILFRLVSTKESGQLWTRPKVWMGFVTCRKWIKTHLPNACHFEKIITCSTKDKKNI